MKISYISDLHLDFHVPFVKNQIKWKQATGKFISKLIETDEGEKEVLVIAGDISHFNRQSMWAIEIFSMYYHQVFVTFGNHDYYLVSKSQSDKYINASKNRANELHVMLLSLPNVHPLLSDKVFTYKGLTFGGNPMWYPIETVKQKMFFNNMSNDSALIKGLNISELHKKSITDYKSMMNKGMDIMISHTPLCPIDSHEKYRSYACYYTPVDEYPLFVIQGHSHEQKVYEKLYCTFYMNALGYPNEKLELSIKSFEFQRKRKNVLRLPPSME